MMTIQVYLFDMCGKKCFSKVEARSALNRNRRLFRKQFRKEQRMYYCEECNCWHLSSKQDHEPNLKIELIHVDRWQKLMGQ